MTLEKISRDDILSYSRKVLKINRRRDRLKITISKRKNILTKPPKR